MDDTPHRRGSNGLADRRDGVSRLEARVPCNHVPTIEISSELGMRMYNLQDYLSCKRPFLSMLLRSAMCSSVLVIAMAVHAPWATAQDGNGYLGYVANTDDGTVSIGNCDEHRQ